MFENIFVLISFSRLLDFRGLLADSHGFNNVTM
jgi:hypothetical protein